MARNPAPTKAKLPKLRGGLKGIARESRKSVKKIDYNINKLSEASIKPAAPVAKPAKKTTTKKTAKKDSKKSGSSKGKGGATYLDLVKRILKDKLKKNKESKGLSVPAILKIVERHYPERAHRKYIRLALAKGVAKKSLVQTRQTFRLSAKEVKRSQKTKKSASKTKKTGTKRKAATSDKKSTKKSTKKATKKTTKKSKSTDTNKKTKRASSKKDTDKKKTKRASSKSGESPKKRAKKSSSSSTESAAHQGVRGTIAEGEGQPMWQYYDNGWFDYEAGASAIVEGVYQEYKNDGTGLEIRPIQSGYFSYQVNFRELTQSNTQTHTVRNIQRTLKN